MGDKRDWGRIGALASLAALPAAYLPKIEQALGSKEMSANTLLRIASVAAPVLSTAFAALAVKGAFFTPKQKSVTGAVPTLQLRENKLERTTDPGVTYKSKMRVVFQNTNPFEIDVFAPEWKAETGDVPLQGNSQALGTLQVEGESGWRANSWSRFESGRIRVGSGEVFRLWIGLDPTHTEEDLILRVATRRVGTLVIPIKANGQFAECVERF